MNSYGKKRDACEKWIVKALESAGATVSKLDGKGIPDLLVGYRGRTYLMECKDPVNGKRNSRSGNAGKANELGLRDSQWDWWQAWKGARPAIVTTPAEALAVLLDGQTMPGEGVFRGPISDPGGESCSAETILERTRRELSRE
jgi:hypothetical protein